MNVVYDLNRAIAYTPKNLCSEIVIDDVAKFAYSSSFHFQRTFSALTGMTVMNYIRKRRLTLALEDLRLNNMRVIDVAFKYAYSSPESFTRAFKQHYGFSPSKAKVYTSNIEVMMPLVVEVHLKGALPMEYRIEQRPNMRFIGISKQFSTVNNQQHVKIPAFWREFWGDERSKIMIENEGKLGVVAVLHNCDDQREVFDYLIGIEADNDLPEFKDVVEIKKSEWAIFTARGEMPKAIQDVWVRIYKEFFPNSNYVHAGLPELEVFIQGDDARSEIWVPVVKNSPK